MLTELDILKDVTGKFDKLGIQYMLTGSLVMSYYMQPRMTKDIDLVVEILPGMIEGSNRYLKQIITFQLIQLKTLLKTSLYLI